MSAEYTPGPWNVTDNHPLRACIKIRDLSGYELAALYRAPGNEMPRDANGIWRNDPERIANARIMAAAPELLEALDEIIKNDPYSQSSAGIIARRAVAKVRGAAQ